MADPSKTQFRDRAVSHLNQVAPVTARGMFGGYGLYSEGVMFALIAYDQLYFKVDEGNRQDYVEAGTSPFVYARQGKEYAMSYYQLPPSVYDDLASLAEWVDRALAAARRSKRSKRKQSV
jgi:DNA transformation protein and related proteins